MSCVQGEWREASGNDASHWEQFCVTTSEFLETKPLPHSFSQSFFESAFYGTRHFLKQAMPFAGTPKENKNNNHHPHLEDAF